VSEKPKSMFVVPKWDNRCVRDLWSSVCNNGMCSLWKINWSNCQYWCCVATSENEREYRLHSQGGSKDDWQCWGFQREHDGTDRKIRGLNKGGELHAIRARMANWTDSLNGARTRQDVAVLLWSRRPTGRICSPVPKTYKWHSNLSNHIHRYHLCSLVFKCRGYSIVRRSERMQISPEKCTWLCECCSTSGHSLTSHPEQASECSSGAPKPYAMTTFYICYDSCLWSDIYIYFISSRWHQCQWVPDDHIYINPSETQ
jgi:hypothetical protein